ncbi:kinase-like domain-containing protein [Auriculariales sp. MPI-PUGE-AT-0066]|nr:kinase-like domain-containing protein [Auriculariales sp. MPI-PUGE-AT-0066]
MGDLKLKVVCISRLMLNFKRPSLLVWVLVELRVRLERLRRECGRSSTCIGAMTLTTLHWNTLDGGDLLNFMLNLDCLGVSVSFSGIKFMHESGFVHRDLKPENILLTGGRCMIAKIADLVFAKEIKNQNRLYSRCGTLNFAAPEIFLSDDGYTNNVDCYSIRAIVYTMLSMSMPFPSINQLNFLDNFCKYLLDKDPNKRMSMPQALNHPFLNDPSIDFGSGWRIASSEDDRFIGFGSGWTTMSTEDTDRADEARVQSLLMSMSTTGPGSTS